MITFPTISPYLFQVDVPKLGTIGPTWYGLMYVVGFLLGYQWAKHRIKRLPTWTELQISDLLTYAIVGVIVGGRVGYVLFYHLDLFLANPAYLFKITEGGMSFHGGLLGVAIAVFLFARKHDKGWVETCDFVTPIVPIGLFFGRIGNFINAELWGKTTDVPWGVVFPNGGPLPRHPSQLYEALLEGLLLFIIMNYMARQPRGRGFLSGLFLLGYGVARFAVEFVRVPDAHLGHVGTGWLDWLTRGQQLSFPMIVIGAGLMLYAQYRGSAESNTPKGEK